MGERMEKYIVHTYTIDIMHTLKYLCDVSKSAYENKINAVVFPIPRNIYFYGNKNMFKIFLNFYIICYFIYLFSIYQIFQMRNQSIKTYLFTL